MLCKWTTNVSAMVMGQSIEPRHWKSMRANRGDPTCSQLAVPASWLHALFCPSYSHPPLGTRQDHHLGFHLVLVHFIWVIRIKCFALSILLSKSVIYPWPQDQLLWLTWFSYFLLFWICCSVGYNLVIHDSWITVLMFVWFNLYIQYKWFCHKGVIWDALPIVTIWVTILPISAKHPQI